MFDCESQKEKDLFDTVFGLVSMGKYKSDIPQLKESLDELRTLMVQKTAGQRKYKKGKDISFDDLPRIKVAIIIGAMCIYLSGDLEILEKIIDERQGGTNG